MDQNTEAIAKIRRHHAALLEGLREPSEVLLAEVSRGRKGEEATREMAEFLAQEILPHAEAEEATIYKRGLEVVELRPLLKAMIAEHGRLRRLAGDLKEETDPARAAAIGYTITELFSIHADKENDLLLPRLAEEPDVSVHDLLGDMHERLEG